MDAAEDAKPTPWRQYWDSENCQQRKKVESEQDYYIYCQPSSRVFYVPSLKLAYWKTPKVASQAFAKYFMGKFPDAIDSLTDVLALPEDVKIFTFVRDPVKQKLSAYSEIDVQFQKRLFPNSSAFMNTTFNHVPRDKDGGRARFRAFLNDIMLKKFGEATPQNWSPSHARTQAALQICQSRRVDFVGHVENMAADWRFIQEMANVPLDMRTAAVPEFHSEKFPLSVVDEQTDIDLEPDLVELLCSIYISDFSCYGYNLPHACKGKGYEWSKSVPAQPQ